MATQPKSLLSFARRTSPAARKIAQLAESAEIAEGQRWFSRERQWIAEQHLAICRIPAPTFFEEKRAAWLMEQLRQYGWNAVVDRAGNVVATWPNWPAGDLIAVTAHLDTVLAPQRAEDITVGPDGRLHGPGVSDNGSGLAALLALGRILSECRALHRVASSVVLVGNVGEEGEGNLSGMRYLCRQSGLAERIQAFLVLDGPSLDHITAEALSSRRYEVTFQGPGGHSWNDQGTANPVHALSHTICTFVQSVDERNESVAGRLAYNFGIIEGGTSVNSIPSQSLAKLDIRSEDEQVLTEFSVLLTEAVERGLEAEKRRAKGGRLTARIKDLGSRPGGKLDASAPLLQTVEAVDAYLHIRSRTNCASTDANIPLSLGMAAISIGTGGQGGRAHTGQEWFHPEGRDLGLRRLLLLVAALAGDAHEPSESLTT